MSSPCTLFGACSCAACSASIPDTPLSVANKSGLTALKYRIGTFSTFRQAMLDYLVSNPVSNPNPADATQTFSLTSRSSDDYGVAMLELWAYVCDVLTFYQQAIANEAYVRTATQQSSVAALAALLGYRPAPAIAASVYLAFSAANNATALLPASLQTQSTPGAGQTAVIFETTNAISAAASSNQLTLLAPPVSIALDRSGLLLNDDPADSLAQGNRLMFFNTDLNTGSEQQVASVTPQPPGKLVAWRGSLGNINPAAEGFYCYRLGRSFRCFGANAPASWLTVTVSGNVPVWGTSQVQFSLDPDVPTGSFLWLDTVYTGLGAGSTLLIRYDGAPTQFFLGAISSVANGSRTLGPVTGSSTGVMLTAISGSFPSGADLRNVTVYELLGVALVFAATGFAQSASPAYPAGSQTLYVLDPGAVGEGTEILLSSIGSNEIIGEAVVLTTRPSVIVQGNVTLAWSLRLLNALENTYDLSNTTVYANVTAATQGESQPLEVLGNGDASVACQEFALRSNPVTYVASAAAADGAASTLQVFVNGIEWTEASTFYNRGPGDQIFVTRTGSDGTFYVRFGDGVTGQRVPTGSGNVTALYRSGAGSNGNVAPGQISTILQSLPGLQSVTNPLGAVGGADGEPVDGTRQNAPVSVLTLGRAVSLRDYEALALTYLNGSITKARASWADFNGRRGVALTVGASGTQAEGQLAQPLRDFLDQHRDPNVPLSIAAVVPVFFVFRAIVHVQAGNLQSQIKAAAEAALGITGDTGYLSSAQLSIGESIYQSKLLGALQGAPGVEWVELKEFSTAFSFGRTGFSPNGISGSPPFPPGVHHKKLDVIYVSPQQIAQPSLSGSVNDVSVDLTYSGGVNDL